MGVECRRRRTQTRHRMGTKAFSRGKGPGKHDVAVVVEMQLGNV